MIFFFRSKSRNVSVGLPPPRRRRRRCHSALIVAVFLAFSRLFCFDMRVRSVVASSPPPPSLSSSSSSSDFSLAALLYLFSKWAASVKSDYTSDMPDRWWTIHWQYGSFYANVHHPVCGRRAKTVSSLGGDNNFFSCHFNSIKPLNVLLIIIVKWSDNWFGFSFLLRLYVAQ